MANKTVWYSNVTWKRSFGDYCISSSFLCMETKCMAETMINKECSLTLVYAWGCTVFNIISKQQIANHCLLFSESISQLLTLLCLYFMPTLQFQLYYHYLYSNQEPKLKYVGCSLVYACMHSQIKMVPRFICSQLVHHKVVWQCLCPAPVGMDSD